MELAVCIEESAQNFWNEHPAVYGPSMNVFVVAGVVVKAGVQVAGQHDTDLDGAKGLGYACELNVNLQTAELSCL